jgi:N-acetylglucosaminylphosphatidylinositol deacetylase
MRRGWAAAFVVVLVALLWAPLSTLDGSGAEYARTNVLLLTAHPDDECMFFAPTLLALVAAGAHVHSLCLSVGNADGLGGVRKHELEGSLDVLGVPPARRWAVDRPYVPSAIPQHAFALPRYRDLQDNITLDWDPRIVSSVIEPYVLAHNISTVRPSLHVRLSHLLIFAQIITFDAGGISNHPNHRSLPLGVSHLLSHTSTPPLPRLLTLVSVPLHIKYIGPLAPLLSKASLYLQGDAPRTTTTTFVAGAKGFATAHAAMRRHWSQLVWFRWLYVLFSRYMWVNDLVEVKVGRMVS